MRLTSVRTMVVFGFGFRCNVAHSYSSASMLDDGITAIDGIGIDEDSGDTVAVGVYARFDIDKRCWLALASVAWKEEIVLFL